MPKPMRVKAKLPWKKVKVSEDLLNSEKFDGLVDIQVLTDYDLVEDDNDDNDIGNKSEVENTDVHKKTKKGKKRKSKTETPDSEIEPVEKILKINSDDALISKGRDIGSKKLQKQKKLNNEKKDNSSSLSEETTELNKASKMKKKKKKAINDVSSVEDQSEHKDDLERLDINNKNSTETLGKDSELKEINHGEILENNSVEIVTDVLDSESASVKKKSKSKKNKERKKKKKLGNKVKQTEIHNADEKVDDQDHGEAKSKEDEMKDSEEVDMSQWANLCVPDPIMKALTKQRFENPTKIQSLTLPSAIRDRRDILGAAETGSGKTLAFGIPVLAKILSIKDKEAKNKELNFDFADMIEDEEKEEFSDMEINDDEEPDACEDEGETLDSDKESDDEEDDKDIEESEEQVSEDNENENEEDREEDVGNSEEEEDSDKFEIYEKSEEEDEEDNKKEVSQGDKIHKPPMALILEPTRELAVQVKKHLTTIAEFTDVQFATIVGGMSIDKQRRILERKPEVIIATPGRLWQLFEEDNAHIRQIDMVHCLVVDEADRMVEKGHYEELTKLLELMNNSERRLKARQTIVMSATLTIDVSAPKRLNNKKKKVTSEDKLKTLTERICVGFKPKVIDLTPKDKVAGKLTELRVNCRAEEKDLYLYYFLCQHPGRTLVFVNSKDCLRRLIALFTLLKCSPLPLHADMHQRQRLKNLDRFAENSKSVLVASDVAARGLDIPKVDHVIHYQVPRTMENYIHRSGRTARASNFGVSLMIVGPDEARDYRKIVQGVRNGEELDVMSIEMELFPAVKERVGLARDIDVKEYRIKKKKMKNNFFQKAAEEMDMIIDDKYLLEDLGDHVEQHEDKVKLKQMKAGLNSMLQGSLQPLRMSKYPTKSGQLQQKKTVDLHVKR